MDKGLYIERTIIFLFSTHAEDILFGAGAFWFQLTRRKDVSCECGRCDSPFCAISVNHKLVGEAPDVLLMLLVPSSTSSHLQHIRLGKVRSLANITDMEMFKLACEDSRKLPAHSWSWCQCALWWFQLSWQLELPYMILLDHLQIYARAYFMPIILQKNKLTMRRNNSLRLDTPSIDSHL